MDTNELKYMLALQMIPKVGPVIAKSLLAYCGSAEEIFHCRKSHLLKIPGVGPAIAGGIISNKGFDRVEEEIAFMGKHQIKPLFFLDKDYPQRLKDLADTPILLFYKGSANLNSKRVLAIVGTRKATDYGKAATERLVEELKPYGAMVVSGLAYGIDQVAHRSSLAVNLATIGVLGHGLDRIYPPAHRSLAARMVQEGGGLLTEYAKGTLPDRNNFPARNRIVAGMVDGLVVVESSKQGGALITAEIAHSYSREVFAIPGRVNDEYSAGCNHFIRINKACLVESAADIAYNLGWDLDGETPGKQEKFNNLIGIEKDIVDLLKRQDKIGLDNLCQSMGSSLTDMSMLLLDMEFKGIIQALPGKFYRLN